MRAIACCCVLCALGGGLAAWSATGAGAVDRTNAKAKPAAHHGIVGRIDRYRQLTWHWQRLMHAAATPSAASARRSTDPAYRRWVLELWRRRAAEAQTRAVRWLDRRVQEYRATVRHWERVMGIRPAPVRSVQAVQPPAARSEAAYRRWKRRAQAVIRRAQHPPYAAQFRCIHRYEGSWTDAGAPYWGGLQMSLSFQRRYGGYLLRTKGTADRWTPLEQLWVAANAVRRGRGFYPWPNTARACGLL